MAAAAGAIFVVALIIVTLITMKIADFIIDSRVGALDRTLGFLFGAARGILVVAVAMLFFNWLVGAQPAGMGRRRQIAGRCSNASAPTGRSLLPDDPENSILKRQLTSPALATSSGTEMRGDRRRRPETAACRCAGEACQPKRRRLTDISTAAYAADSAPI